MIFPVGKSASDSFGWSLSSFSKWFFWATLKPLNAWINILFFFPMPLLPSTYSFPQKKLKYETGTKRTEGRADDSSVVSVSVTPA